MMKIRSLKTTPPTVPLTSEELDDVKFVFDKLGETVTATLANAKHRDDVFSWIGHSDEPRPGKPVPSPDQLKRIRFAAEIYRDVVQAQAAKLTYDWFIGKYSPKGADPVSMIQDGRYDEVREAAEIFKQENR